MSDKTYTEDDVTKAVAEAIAAATAPLKAELETLKSSAVQGEVEARIAKINEDHETAMQTVKADLDAANVAKATVDTALAELQRQHDDTLAYLTDEAARITAESEAKAKEGERVEAVKEFNLTDEYVQAQCERWARMADEDFDAYVDGLRAVAAASKPEGGGTSGGLATIPSSTAMAGTRPPTGAKASSLDELSLVRRQGVSTRNL